jgi:two-component system, cell cycle sensor histidine kinase and response regulator CckA
MISQKENQLFFENCNEALFISTPEGRCLHINPASVEFFGYESEEEMLGLDIGTDIYVSLEDRKRFLKKLEEKGYVKNYKVKLKMKDGKRITALTSATAIMNEKGDIVKYQGIHYDITGRAQERQELKESRDRLDLALKTAEMGVWQWDIVNNRIDLDEQSFRILGIDQSTFKGTIHEFYSVVHPGDRDTLRSILYFYAESNNISHIAEYRAIWPDGSVHYLAGRGKIKRDRNGAPLKILGVHWDVTEHKQALKELEESHERFRHLVQQSNDAIVLSDEKGIVKFVSGPIERVLGYSPEEFTGSGFRFDLVHPEDTEYFKKSFAECVQQEDSIRTFEYRGLHKNGKWVTLEAIGVNLLHHPVVRGIVINLRDISERNKLQEQLRQAMKMEAIGKLAGGVAHDFNNLLTVIDGNVELALADIAPDNPLVQHLNKIMKASDSAASLTRQLLAFSQKQIIAPRVLNLNDLVRNVKHMLERLIGEDIKIGFKLVDDLGSVRIDAGQFDQVLINLAVNARDAMPHGGKLTIETANITLDEGCGAIHPQLKPGRYVMLEVSDTGHGISAENKECIFEPFFTTKKQGQGTGLGLSTILGIVRQAGGVIECDSEESKGATFRIYLPLVEEQPERLIKERRSVARLKGDETILLVEDSTEVRDATMMMLEDLGYSIITACGGEEALMRAEKHNGKIDLLMTDVVMPGMNGRELSEQMTNLHPEIKILFCSGYTNNIIVRNGVIDKSINFIGKPYSMQALAGKIREILRAKK